ncbi:hypothetical protein GF325_09115 [Candidatus Bathyarchaeota archaeon]|nr:hypothetical protein [Candidatus Bathyarchaeota archaeon]
MNREFTFKELSYIYLTCGTCVAIAIAQFLFFKNDEANFDPHVFIYIFSGMNIITIVAFRLDPKMDFKRILFISLYTRSAIILIQVFLFIALGMYNITNEVEYYELLARTFLGTPSLYSDYIYGMPMGYQFWLLINYLGYMQFLEGFWQLITMSILNVALELGILFLIHAMGAEPSIRDSSRKMGNPRDQKMEFGMLIYALSAIPVYYYNVRVFIDPFPILLGIAGVYCFYKGMHELAAILLSISILVKFISLFWLILIIIHLLSKRKVKIVIKYGVISGMIAFSFFLAGSLYYQETLLDFFLSFFPKFHGWSTFATSGLQLNQSFWMLVYKPWFLPMILGGLILLCFLIEFKGKGMSLHSFSLVVACYLIFQPWYDQRYFLWVFPFLCIDLMGSRKTFTRMHQLASISIFIYLFSLHFVNDLGINTLLDNDPYYIGLIYRLTGQLLSYIVLAWIIGKEIQYQFGLKERMRSIITRHKNSRELVGNGKNG